MKRDRVQKLLHRAVSTFLMREFPASGLGVLITVTEVIVFPDGRGAKVFVSFMSVGGGGELSDGEVEEMMERLGGVKSALKRYLAMGSGRGLRRIPEVFFVVDRSALRASRVSKILGELGD